MTQTRRDRGAAEAVLQSRSSSSNGLGLGHILAIAMACLAGLGFLIYSLTYQVPIALAGGELVIGELDADTHFVFTPGAPKQIDGVLYELRTFGNELKNFGASGALIYLTKADYAAYREFLRRSPGACPASFLSPRIKVLSIFASDPDVAREFKSSSARRGTEFSIDGSSIQFKGGSYRGNPISSMSSSGQAQAMIRRINFGQ